MSKNTKSPKTLTKELVRGEKQNHLTCEHEKMWTHTKVELCAFVIVPLDTSVGGDPNNTSEISSKDSLLKKPRAATKKT